MKKLEKQSVKSVRSQTLERKINPENPYDLLEPVEEKVLRMHYGLSENDDKALEYAVSASEDTRWRVTLMEANNIADLEGEVPLCEGADAEAIRAWVGGLQEL